MSYPGIFWSFLILGALGSGVNSGRPDARDEMHHYADEERNQAKEASPATPSHAELRFCQEGHG